MAVETQTPSKQIGVWGPTNSYESDDASFPAQMLQSAKLTSNRNTQSTNGGTHTTKTSDTSSDPTMSSTAQPNASTSPSTPMSIAALKLERMFESASAAVESLVKSAATVVASGSRMTSSPDETRTTVAETPSPQQQQQQQQQQQPARQRAPTAFEVFVEEACTSPCSGARQVGDSPPRRYLSATVGNDIENAQGQQGSLGIVPLVSPGKLTSRMLENENRIRIGVSVDLSDIDDTADGGDSPSGQRTSGLDGKSKKSVNGGDFPMKTLAFKNDPKYDISRSISELTMKSSHGEHTFKVAESRRMAYYAVGKHHKVSGRGGNRRCYFTGKLILGGAPFYAGSVQQGLRTLVVFCLPSALGLPKDGTDRVFQKQSSDLTSLTKRSNASSQGVIPLPREYVQAGSALKRVSTMGTNSNRSRSASMSKSTSVDDLSFLEEELDPNWDLDRDYLLQNLPDPSKDLLDEMSLRYPDQFETLPVQVRSPHCWRLFVKFCFFSGLPIAEGELHYKVRDEIAMDVYGEEVTLSHEVMEAVNGDSAEILRLPNQKTFKYLRKHYTQQSGKLSDAVFQRTSWEMVRPEV
jgi:hypothetical protein